MKAPEGLETLVDYGIIQEVIRPLMSGKEAQVYVVLVEGEECVAKVYKEATQRTFKHRSEYTEGRRTRNSRDQRAVSKRTQHGRKKDEDAWRSTEVETIYRLRDAGVRVPEPINFVEGVLVMELVKDAAGEPAPRLGDLSFRASEAKAIYEQLIGEVVRMLCAGVIHGDLSEFNVLMGQDGPVVIDFPQSVDPTRNPNSEKLLLRDVENLNRFLARSAPNEPRRAYGEEIWSLFQRNHLEPKSTLTGRYVAPEGKANTREVMELIEDAHRDEMWRRGDRKDDDAEDFDGPVRSPVKAAAAPFRKVVDFTPKTHANAKSNPKSRVRSKARPKAEGAPKKRGARSRRASSRGSRPSEALDKLVPPTGPASDSDRKSDTPGRSRRRRRSGRPRAGTDIDSKSEGPKSDSTSTGKAPAGGRARRPANTGKPSEGGRVSADGAGKARTPSRRRRRAPKSSTPK